MAWGNMQSSNKDEIVWNDTSDDEGSAVSKTVKIGTFFWYMDVVSLYDLIKML